MIISMKRVEIKMSSTKDTQDTSSSRKGMSSSKHNLPRRQFANSRRERPRKLRVFRDELPRNQDLYHADIDSFTSACAAGISFRRNDDGNNTTNTDFLSPRTSSIQKRSLPSLSFLATTTIAAEKKKLKIEEEKRQEAIAEMEARKALALNPLHSMVIDVVGETKEEDNMMSPSMNNLSSGIESTKVIKNTTASNVLMPPLLQQFLDRRNKGGEEKEGVN